MTVRALAGLVAFNLLVLGAGAILLWGLGAIRWWTDVVRLAGVAYLVGLGALMVALTAELALGLHIGMVTATGTWCLLVVAGLLTGYARGSPRPRPPVRWRFPRISLLVASLVVGMAFYFQGVFRAARLSSILPEWDGWALWIPKAKAIYYFGALPPGLLRFFPNQAYPPGIPAIHALAFHAMGSADDVTLHLQYWFYALGFTGAVIGLLADRTRQNILIPTVMLALLAPSFITRVTWTYVDLPLGYLVALAALLVVLWLEERQSWQLVAAVVLLSGAMLTKREGLLFAACVLLAGFAASWNQRGWAWPRLAVAGVACYLLALPWRLWFIAHGIPGDGPTGGYLGASTDLARGWPTLRLVVTTLFDPEFWLLAPTVCAVAVVLAALARSWVPAIYALVFAMCTIAAATWIIWSDPTLPLTQDDALNPIVRLTGTSILVLVVLTPLLLERAWAAGSAGVAARRADPGPDAIVWRSAGVWVVVVLAALVYPASMLAHESRAGLPGGLPRFPSTSDCVVPPISGDPVRLVFGYADSYPGARTLRRRALAAGAATTRIAQDGCGRLRVFVDHVPSLSAGRVLESRFALRGLSPTLELDRSDSQSPG
jgi:hypothetical protein